MVNNNEIVETEDASSEIKTPFDPSKINITLKPLIVDSLIKRIKNKPARIDLNTDFQRSGDLWSKKNQSRLIESLLVRIPLPAFYFDGTDEDNWKVVDGLQRLTTLKNYIVDESFELTELEYLKEYEGRKYSKLPPFLQGRIEETHITAYIINPGTPPEVKYNIFRRINTGGLILTPQEIRHALNQGIPADFIKELSKSAVFTKATDNRLKNSKRMEDRDFVTRFVGFYIAREEYKPDLDTFLNFAMGKLNSLTKVQRLKIKEDFLKAMNAAYNIFGRDAFRKRFSATDNRKPLNKALFEALSVNLAIQSIQNIDVLVSNSKLVKRKFIELMNKDEDFVRSITSGTGDVRAVERRFSKIGKLINEVLNA